MTRDATLALNRAIAYQARVSLDIARTFGVSDFRIEASAHAIRVRRTSRGDGHTWKCGRCGMSGACVPLARGQGDATLPLARFLRQHTGPQCP